MCTLSHCGVDAELVTEFVRERQPSILLNVSFVFYPHNIERNLKANNLVPFVSTLVIQIKVIIFVKKHSDVVDVE